MADRGLTIDDRAEIVNRYVRVDFGTLLGGKGGKSAGSGNFLLAPLAKMEATWAFKGWLSIKVGGRCL